MTGRRFQAPPRSRGASPLGIHPAWLLAALVLVLVGVDAFRIGFFADDMHFIDVARREPLLEVLPGQRGIWPWYRPLSREVFFEVVMAFGPAAIVVAHALSIGALLASALLLARLGTDGFGREVGLTASALFVANGFIKFVTAWPSGFQDVLALALT